MKHAGSEALSTLAPVLNELRRIAGLTERKPGIFYRGGVAFVHFHEDPAGLFADLKRDGRFARFPVNDATERGTLVAAARAALVDAATTSRTRP